VFQREKSEREGYVSSSNVSRQWPLLRACNEEKAVELPKLAAIFNHRSFTHKRKSRIGAHFA
ncbi:MAG: hypothetical protein ACRD82_08485, partial [Blastocatellia bacterium]